MTNYLCWQKFSWFLPCTSAYQEVGDHISLCHTLTECIVCMEADDIFVNFSS